MVVPRLGVESELESPAFTRATATLDPSHFFDLHHSSQEHWILNPVSKARDQTCNLLGSYSDSFPLHPNRNSWPGKFCMLWLWPKTNKQTNKKQLHLRESLCL